MNQGILENAIMLPSELERQQIFYWLQKASSVSAWRHVLELYKAWVDVTGNSVREADKSGWSNETTLSQSSYARILEGLRAMEAGVHRLAKGDKRVLYFDVFGEFATVWVVLGDWLQTLNRIQMGENSINEHTPLWAEFDEVLSSLGYAWDDCATPLHIPRIRHSISHRATPIFYGDWLKAKLKTLNFPDELEPVPNPIENVFVRTYRSLPWAGIWEPVEAPRTSFIRSLVSAPKPQPPFKVVGAMNYFNEASIAPHLTVETASGYKNIRTTWLSLWRDDRYTDGTVPEMESHYDFANINTLPEHRKAITATGQWICDNSGIPACATGRWFDESDLAVSIRLEKGEELPLHQGRHVRWALAKN